MKLVVKVTYFIWVAITLITISYQIETFRNEMKPLPGYTIRLYNGFNIISKNGVEVARIPFDSTCEYEKFFIKDNE